MSQHVDESPAHEWSAHDQRTAVDKAVSLLLAFGEDMGAGIGVSELARRTAMSKSTAFRVLATLTRSGIVERVGNDYRLGRRLHDLGNRAHPYDHDVIRETLTPFLVDLYELTRETVHLAVLQGDDVVYLNKLYGHRRVNGAAHIGGRAPAYCTGIGKALLAHDADVAAGVLSRRLRPLTRRTVVDKAVLSAQLTEIRTRGIAFDHEEARLGLSCVAVPVLAADGTAIAALSVAGITGRIDARRVAPVLRQVARDAGLAATRAARRTGRQPVFA